MVEIACTKTKQRAMNNKLLMLMYLSKPALTIATIVLSQVVFEVRNYEKDTFCMTQSHDLI